MKYFDKQNNRLVFMGEETSPDFWDRQWNTESFKRVVVEGGKKNKLVVNTTKKYIAPNKSKKILEAGCGNGKFVYALRSLGYDSYGVDYAGKTVMKIKAILPDLKVMTGDVRKLDFPDGYFDGCWSIGVIEHFFDGYTTIINEAERVIKPGGFLFITFPHISILRKIKIKLGFYPLFNEKFFDRKKFYQFALDHHDVLKKIKKNNFTLVQKTCCNGTKGFKDEVYFLKPLLQRIYDSHNILLRILNHGLSIVLSEFSSHSILLIFRKNKY